MGLSVEKDLNFLKGKTLVGYNFNGHNENVLYLEDKATGDVRRFRIPSEIRNMFEMYWSITQQHEDAKSEG